MKRLRKFIEEHPYVNVLRFTTFFHQFTLIFDELAREKYVDWYGYSASVSPYILEQFEPVSYTHLASDRWYLWTFKEKGKSDLDFAGADGAGNRGSLVWDFCSVEDLRRKEK